MFIMRLEQAQTDTSPEYFPTCQQFALQRVLRDLPFLIPFDGFLFHELARVLQQTT